MAENESPYRPIANPRRTTLAHKSVQEAAAPHREEPVLTLLTDDAATCVDGMCAIAE